MSEIELNEPLLSDDYPVYYGYLYVVDGRVERSDIQGKVADLKRDITVQGRSAQEIRKCDMLGRGFFTGR